MASPAEPRAADRKQDQAAQPQSLLRDGGEQWGTMGTSTTKEQEAVCQIVEAIWQKHHAEVEGFDLRRPLVWVSRNVEGVDGAAIYDTETWDKAGVRLWDAATRSDPVAKDLLGPRRVVFERLKKHAESTVPIEPTTAAVVGVTANGCDDEDSDPLEPGPMSPNKEPGLYPAQVQATFGVQTAKRQSGRGTLTWFRDCIWLSPAL